MKSRLSSLAIGILTAVALCAMSPVTDAATKTMTTKVKKVRITAGSDFGGCMVELAASPKTVLPACAAGWVTFSCSGNFTDVARAYRMLDQAQLAYTLGKSVSVVIDDAKKHNGYCFASRIDIQ